MYKATPGLWISQATLLLAHLFACLLFFFGRFLYVKLSHVTPCVLACMCL